jgi:hypothetical protein
VPEVYGGGPVRAPVNGRDPLLAKVLVRLRAGKVRRVPIRQTPERERKRRKERARG